MLLRNNSLYYFRFVHCFIRWNLYKFHKKCKSYISLMDLFFKLTRLHKFNILALFYLAPFSFLFIFHLISRSIFFLFLFIYIFLSFFNITYLLCVLKCLAFSLHVPTNSPKFGANCLEPYALLEFKQGSWRYSF